MVQMCCTSKAVPSTLPTMMNMGKQILGLGTSQITAHHVIEFNAHTNLYTQGGVGDRKGLDVRDDGLYPAANLLSVLCTYIKYVFM